jgi:AsmA protein
MEDEQHIAAAEEPAFLPEDLEPRPFTPPPRHRVLWTLAAIVVLFLLAVIPPLVHVNRYQRQIAQSISQSLGRPVRMGEVSLTLLPFPGFTIKEFNVADDPAFSSEPVIHATSVMARLRWRSLWLRRVEFSRITLTDASVNLVRRGDGNWNFESILLQASRMPAAPTGQRGAGDRPRFPYIEASGARINVKMGLEKLPFSLTDADFALWLPEAQQYRVRLEAHPARTDAAVTDTGVMRLEGTVGRAATLAAVPVDLHAAWTAAPLGAASLVLAGRDMGFRGELTFDATLQGTAGDNALATRLQLERVRRADFVPARLLDIDLRCTARALGNLHRLEDVRCGAGGLTVTGEVADTLSPGTANLQADLKDFPAAALTDLLHLASARVAPGLTLGGTASLHAACCTPGQWLTAGELNITQAVLADGDATPFVAGDLSGQWRDGAFDLPAIPLNLGESKPALLGVRVDGTGYQLSLAGPARRDRLEALAAAVPQFGEGLPVASSDSPDLVLQLVSERKWGGAQTWAAPEVVPVVKKRRGR